MVWLHHKNWWSLWAPSSRDRRPAHLQLWVFRQNELRSFLKVSHQTELSLSVKVKSKWPNIPRWCEGPVRTCKMSLLQRIRPTVEYSNSVIRIQNTFSVARRWSFCHHIGSSHARGTAEKKNNVSFQNDHSGLTCIKAAEVKFLQSLCDVRKVKGRCWVCFYYYF